MADGVKAITQRIYEMFSSGDTTGVEELVTPDMIDHEMPPEVTSRGPQLLREGIAMFRSAFPDLKMTPLDVVAEGDKVAIRFRMSGTHQGDFQGIPATGKSFEIEGLDLIRFENGKAAEHWGFSDDVGMMRQLGIGQ